MVDHQYGPEVTIEDDVEIGAHTILHPGVYLGKGTRIGAFCELGVPSSATDQTLVIGAGATIRSHSVFYAGSSFGPGMQTGHSVMVREKTKAGKRFQMGTLCDIEGHSRFGDDVRLHSNVHIGQGSTIEDFVLVFPYVVLTNDATPPSDRLQGVTIKKYAVVATMSTVLPGVRIGQGALIGAMTLVRQDVPDDSICVGVPGKVVGSTEKIRFKDTGKLAYPWRRQFHRGYPVEVVEKWKREFPDG